MEISLDSEPRSPPRRRRSTFFVRRESLAPEPQTEAIAPNATQKKDNEDDKHCKELERYSAALMSEKEQWKTEVKERKNKYRDLKQQYNLTVSSSNKSKFMSCYSSLSNEDIDFFKQQVNIRKFLETQSELHKSVQFTMAVYQKVEQLENELLTSIETQVNKAREYIFENSSLEDRVLSKES